MRKRVYLVLVVISVFLSGCELIMNNGENTSNDVIDTTTITSEGVKEDLTQFASKIYVDKYKQLVDIVETDTDFEIIFSLGAVNDCVVEQVTPGVRNTGGAGISASDGTVDENSISGTISASVTVKLGGGAFIPFETTAELGASVTEATSFAVTKQSTISFDLDSYELNKYYAIFLTADYEIRQIFKVNKTNGEVQSFMSAVIISNPGYELYSSIDNDFSFEIVDDYALEEIDYGLIFDGGQGTENDPFTMSNEYHLFALMINPDKYYVLESDIELVSYQSGFDIDFSGYLDGNDYTISNLSINISTGSKSNDVNYGLFKELSGSIKNLKISSAVLLMESHDGNHDGDGFLNVGVIAGYASNTSIIQNVVVVDSKVEVHRNKSAIGGVVGHSEGTILNSTVITTYIRGNGDMGGIVGRLTNGGCISDCTFEGLNNDSVISYSTIHMYSTQSGRSSGGIVGYCNGSIIENVEVAYVTFIMRGDDNERPAQGYIVGNLTDSTLITFSYSNNDIQDDMDNWLEDTSSIICWGCTEPTDDYYFPDDHEYVGYISNSTVTE